MAFSYGYRGRLRLWLRRAAPSLADTGVPS
jgi:hypothetical protein